MICARVPGIVDSHVFQVPDAPTLGIDVDRARAMQLGLAQRATAEDVLVTTNSSAQSAPNFWIDPHTRVSYPLVVQLPTYQVDSTHDLWTMPLTAGGAGSRGQTPDESRELPALDGSPGALTAEHPTGVRRQCRRAGPRPLLRGRRDRRACSPRTGPAPRRRSRSP